MIETAAIKTAITLRVESLITQGTALTVTQIRPYSLGHLFVCLLVVFCVGLMALWMSKKKNRTRLFFSTGVLLTILEIWKQFLILKIYGAFSWSDFPFQLCSIPMYLCLLYPFCKKGRRTIELFFRSFGILGAIAAFAVPYDVFSKYLLLSLQSILWHGILLFLGIYCIAASDSCEEVSRADIARLAALYAALAVVAVGLNACFYQISQGASNLFFLGPSRPCVVLLDDIYEKYGWIAESLAMGLVSEAAGISLLLVEALFGKHRPDRSFP